MQALKAVEKLGFLSYFIYKAPCSLLLPQKLTTKTNATFLIIKPFQCQLTTTPEALPHSPAMQSHSAIPFTRAHRPPAP